MYCGSGSPNVYGFLTSILIHYAQDFQHLSLSFPCFQALLAMNIEVVARIRTPRRGENISLNLSGTRVQAADGTGHIFNTVYKSESLTFDVFKDSFSPLVELFVAGYNVCVLVFGESSSGKSFTIAGEKTAKAGLIPLLINAVFTTLKGNSADRRDVRLNRNQRSDGVVSVQLYEMYNEKVRDLLLLPHEGIYLWISAKSFLGLCGLLRTLGNLIAPPPLKDTRVPVKSHEIQLLQ